MTNIEIVQAITAAFCDNQQDDLVLAKYFDPGFHHTFNGVTTDLTGYGVRLTKYSQMYKRFDISEFDELFAVEDKVIAAYTLSGERLAGSIDQIAVIGIWHLIDEKVIHLHEVDAPVSADTA